MHLAGSFLLCLCALFYAPTGYRLPHERAINFVDFHLVSERGEGAKPGTKGFLAPSHVGRYEHADFAGGADFQIESVHDRMVLIGSFGPPRILRYLRDLLGPTWSNVIPRVRTFRRLRVLTRREARVVEAVAETIFPSEGTEMPTVREAQVVEYFDDLLAHLEFKERALIRGLIALLEIQTLVFNGTKPRLFTRASPEERTRNLLGWETSRIFQRRLVFMAIRTILLWAYVDSQEAERGMGFVPGTNRTLERKTARERAARQAMKMARGGSSPPEDTEAAFPVRHPAPKGAPREPSASLTASPKEQA